MLSCFVCTVSLFPDKGNNRWLVTVRNPTTGLPVIVDYRKYRHIDIYVDKVSGCQLQKLICLHQIFTLLSNTQVHT